MPFGRNRMRPEPDAAGRRPIPMMGNVRWLIPVMLAVLLAACGRAGTGPAVAGSAASGTGSARAAAVSPARSPAASPARPPGRTAATTPAPRASVSVTGRVAAGPVTPVAQAGHPASRPVPGVRVEALRGTRVVAVARTGRRGYYRLRLRPGLYVIMVRVRGLPAQQPMSRTIIVSAGTRQIVNFTVDTGIR
jgi:hypothetical protein